MNCQDCNHTLCRWRSDNEICSQFMPLSGQPMPEFLAREKAEAHWEFLESWQHKIFVDAFVHGYKHAQEDK